MLLSILYIIGITAEAMTGALAAGKRHMDWFGVMLVASATAIGGGTVRDILLGHYPLGWVAHPQYLIITCVAGILTTYFARWVVRFHKVFILLDAIGLIVFSIIGCQVAMTMGLSPIICVVAAVVTGVFGGLLRDMITRRKPMVLHKELYASVAFIAGIMYYAMSYIGVHPDITTLITLITGFSLRMAAVYFSWSLPVFEFKEESFQ
ncbi:trimeric intracellular cation channel family protein [Photobacterium angustum]|uniref:trimeric intracellular cation channel family protein n=1 Tax=Photobacterium angustum TaxID=661 RepID=UPI0005DC31F3|nr:trimeric intracellular cation channel family protein [Photobacterium angustum]KJG18154.1 membrane protein [Photobacterium angustum]KJG26246.1 membrane protein [Photobacterium angustum]KJG32255.1 membrane protein [Photobacterium angustum]PSW93391.1 trimeric intracellular cation channel family protein [Photobacterium angustum]PSX02511.1 trimeric intracellular cation channel family protein [Photobacterium angustum]